MAVGGVAALLGEVLVFDLDHRDAGFLIAAHGVGDVEQPAVAGVAVGDQRLVDGIDDRFGAVDHVGVGGQARVGLAQVRGHDPVAGHVDRLCIGAIGDLGRDQIENARGGDELLVLQDRLIELFDRRSRCFPFLVLCSIRKCHDPAPGIDQSNKLSDVFDPDIEWLRLISRIAIAVAVLEEQHVRRAAERLGVPQPTVSAVMHRLADAIGAPFVRRAGVESSRPRLAGRSCRGTTGVINLRAAGQDLQEVIDPDRGHVALGFAHSRGPTTYPGCSTRFWPHIPISRSPSSRERSL